MVEKHTFPVHEAVAETAVDIRLLQAENAEYLFELYQRNREQLEAVSIYVPADTEDVIDKIRFPMPEGRMDFCIFAGTELVGEIDLIPQASKDAQIIYWIDRHSQGHGYGRKAVTAIAEHAFGALNMDMLRAWVDEDNFPSRRTLERVGFIHEDTNTAVQSLGYTLTRAMFQARDTEMLDT